MKNNKTKSKTKKRNSKQGGISFWFQKTKIFLSQTLWASRNWFSRILLILIAVMMLISSVAYGISRYYFQKHAAEQLKIGATFIPEYADYFGLDPKETLQASIDDLGIKRFRLVTYWKTYEPQPDQYDFTQLDWQFDMVEAAGGEIALTLGLRQPRWPECHGPEWAMNKPVEQWSKDLNEFMGVVIDRYKDRKVLVEYQLENEYLLDVFGVCPDHTRQRLVDEFNYVKAKDPTRTLIVNRSNNAVPSWPVGEPRADVVGAAVYKRVWDKTVTKRNFEYPFPPWFYGFLAGGTELTTGRESIIHELQTEAWLPEGSGYDMYDAPLDLLYDTYGPNTVQPRIKYAVDTGIRTIDLWGIEWWYQLKTQRNAPEIWNNVKAELKKYNN